MARSSLSTWVILAILATSGACSDTEGRPPLDAGVDEDSGDAYAQNDAAVSDANADAAAPDAGEPTALPLDCQVEPCFQRVVGDGADVVCALATTGKVWCWGGDGEPDVGGYQMAKGALGRGAPVTDPNLAATPMPIPSLDSITGISVGRRNASCAVRDDGSVWCWGTQPEFGFTNPPSRVAALDAADHVVADMWIGCAVLRADHSAWCWGPPGSSQLPEGADGRPMRAPRVTRPVRQIGLAAGRVQDSSAILLLMEDRSIVSWGSAPGRPSSLAGGRDPNPAEIDVVARGLWVGALRFIADGRGYAWGDAPGALIAHPVPRLDGSKLIEMGERIAIDANGDVFVWGSNAWGELGAAPEALARAEAPVPVTLPARARSVASAASGAHCASLVDGSVVCWGRNLEGQLGRRTRDAEPHPRPERIAP